MATPQFNLALVASGFVMLALVEGSFTFMSGRLAAQTAEGTTRRLRNYLFDHIQHLPFFYHKRTETGELIQRSTSDVDALRRFFADQAIGVGRIILLFAINFIAIINLNTRLGCCRWWSFRWWCWYLSSFSGGYPKHMKPIRSRKQPYRRRCKRI
jgi:ABC-type multidrug transport system fused ATPase/permease subunit